MFAAQGCSAKLESRRDCLQSSCEKSTVCVKSNLAMREAEARHTKHADVALLGMPHAAGPPHVKHDASSMVRCAQRNLLTIGESVQRLIGLAEVNAESTLRQYPSQARHVNRKQSELLSCDIQQLCALPEAGYSVCHMRPCSSVLSCSGSEIWSVLHCART